MNKVVLGAAALAALALAAAPAVAHHSGAMFDRNKTLKLTGTVKEFQYTNPHSWLQVNVTGPDGKVTEWAFEAEGPSTLLRAGIKRSTLVPGEKVTVTTNPLKDGRPGGSWVCLTKGDGAVVNPHPGASHKSC